MDSTCPSLAQSDPILRCLLIELCNIIGYVYCCTQKYPYQMGRLRWMTGSLLFPYALKTLFPHCAAQISNEPAHDKTKKNGMCAKRRLRSAWASAQSDQSLRCPHEGSLGPLLPTERTAKTDQTWRMPGLI